MPSLLLLNGNPGMGKSTLAQRYADEHPLALNLEVDRLWHMIGHWQAEQPVSDYLKIKHALQLADAHLAEGYDVIVPNLIEQPEICVDFERIARRHGAIFKEFVLLSTPEDAVERCKIRGKAMGFVDGFRPGGVLDTTGREVRLKEMHANVECVTQARPNTIRLHSVYGQTAETYQALVRALTD